MTTTKKLLFSRALRALWGTISAAVILSTPARAQQDINIIAGTSPYVILGRGLQWGGSGFGTINNNFIFTPASPDEGVCLFITNNNPGFTHTITIGVLQTGDPSVKQFQSVQGKWTSVPSSTAFPVSINPNNTLGLSYKTSASAGITVQFSGGTTQSGNDTADVFVVQTTTSSCGALPSNIVQGPFQQGSAALTPSQKFPVQVGGLNSTLGAAQTLLLGPQGSLLPDGSAQTPPAPLNSPAAPQNFYYGLNCSDSSGGSHPCLIPTVNAEMFGLKVVPGVAYSDVLEMGTMEQFYVNTSARSFYVIGKITNPGVNATLLHQYNLGGGTIDLQYKRALIDCSAACEVLVNRTTAAGTTCTVLTPGSLSFGSGGRGSVDASNKAENACATQPATAETFFDVSLTNIPYALDLSGFLNPHGSTTTGIDFVNVASLTGVVTVTLEYVQLP